MCLCCSHFPVAGPEGYSVECILGLLKLLPGTPFFSILCAYELQTVRYHWIESCLPGPYLALATKTVTVGTLFGAKIEQITKVALVPISRRQLDSSEAKSV